jgi:hypothetical protein
MQHMSRVQKSLARHASAQNAQATYFLAALNDNHAQLRINRRPGRRVSGAAAADHCDIVVK